jgi:hypothetical protein
LINVLALSRVAYTRDHFGQESAHFLDLFHVEQTVTDGRMFKQKMKRKMKTPLGPGITSLVK